MAVTDADGIIYYRYIYDTYGELSDITTDDGVSLKSSEQLTEYRLAELSNATGIDYLYNGQYGVETDSNGLYYMRARYYNQDIKRFINRDVVSGDISNSQSLNRYCYVQGNPVSLTDPFGLCPDPNSNFKNFCKFLYYTDWSAIGHAALDVAGLFWDGADVINALWYALERNPEMAIASAIFAIPGAGIGIGNLMMKSEKLASAGKAVRAVSKFTQSAIGVGAGMSIATVGYQNLRHSIEAGEFSLTDLATFIGGLTIAAISGKGLISSGKDFASLFDDVGKTSKAGKGYLTDADVNSMPIGGNQAKVSSLSPGSSRAVTGACFVAGTLIKTDDGYQTVEDLAVGDYVYAKNTETGETGYKKVVRLFRKQVTELVHLQIGGEEINTTTNHPFWVDGYGFKEAGELVEGELVETAEGTLLPVISVSREQLAEPVTVYNFEVEDWHTYYVSEEEVLVHNDCMVKPGDVSKKKIIAKPNHGQGFSPKGYNPKPGERTLAGYVQQNADPEIALYTKSAGFNNGNGNIGGQFKRIGADEHYGLSPHVHQPIRNVAPNGSVFGKTGKTVGVDTLPPSNKDIKQLYEYLNNGKYHK